MYLLRLQADFANFPVMHGLILYIYVTPYLLTFLLTYKENSICQRNYKIQRRSREQATFRLSWPKAKSQEGMYRVFHITFMVNLVSTIFKSATLTVSLGRYSIFKQVDGIYFLWMFTDPVNVIRILKNISVWLKMTVDTTICFFYV